MRGTRKTRLGDITYLSTLQEVDVVLPDLEAILVLANVAKREIVTFPDNLTRIRTGCHSPARSLSVLNKS